MEILKSKKFLTGLVASVVNVIVIALGFPIEVAMLASSPLAGSLVAQGVVDVRKSGASAGTVASIVLAVGLVTGAAVSTGCGSVQRAGASAIDCLAPRTARVAAELTGVVSDALRLATGNDGRVDWTAVKSSVAGFASDGPRCAFRAVIVEAMRPRSNGVQAAGLEYSADDLRAGYAAVNAQAFADRLAPL